MDKTLTCIPLTWLMESEWLVHTEERTNIRTDERTKGQDNNYIPIGIKAGV